MPGANRVARLRRARFTGETRFPPWAPRLARYWSGGRVNHDGRHYQVRDVTLLPASVHRPRPPVWIGGFWPHRRPMRGALGRRRSAVHQRRARTSPTSRPGPRPRCLHREAPRGRSRHPVRDPSSVEPAQGTPPRHRRRSRRWPTPVPRGGTNGSSKAATTSTSGFLSCGESTWGRRPSSAKLWPSTSRTSSSRTTRRPPSSAGRRSCPRPRGTCRRTSARRSPGT
jgi:hypothetical protein